MSGSLLKTTTALREVCLAGMPKGHAAPLWTLRASAPHFMAPNALRKSAAGQVRSTGVTADHVHPVRSIALDWPGAAQGWAHPALLDLHVIVAAPGKGTIAGRGRDYAFGDQLLTIAASGQAAPVRAGGDLYYSITDGELLEPRSRPASGFAHVLAQPLDSAEPWPVADNIIRLPPLRAVAGRIALHVKLCENDGKDTAFGWLRRLRIREIQHHGTTSKRRWANLWLTPDGIEFDAEDLPFPHSPSPLAGRVRLDVVDPAAARPVHALTLLETQDKAAWLQAWRRITPDAAQETQLRGIALKADRSRVPAFRWRIGGGSLAAGTVDIPGDSLLVSLVSPPVRGSADGSARLVLDWLQAGPADAKSQHVRLAATHGMAAGGSVPLRIDADSERLSLHCEQEIVFAINDDRLAQDLRRAYGLPSPSTTTSETSSATQASQRSSAPLVPAFFAVQDGWLQLPVPNLVPRDPGSDASLASAPSQARDTVLDGYFRIRRPGAGAAVQTAAQPGSPFLGGPPFELALTRAAGVALEIELKLGGGAATPLRAQVKLHQASLLTQGLATVSASAPDALDALPRLSDGPGRIMALQMRAVLGTQDESATSTLLVALNGFSVEVAQDQLPALGQLRMDICLNETHPDWRMLSSAGSAHQPTLNRIAEVLTGVPSDPGQPGRTCPAVAWLRHRRTAAAAAMPMTRSAAAAVRPLESRDLFPYVITPDGSPARRRLATLWRTTDAPFYGLPLEEGQKPAACWPLKHGDDRGVFFAVLGVPGLELCPRSPLAATGALRLDLPTLDEAFAMAELPQAPGAATTVAPVAAATSLDWPALAEFWQRQERKLQNARVDRSYATAFHDEGAPQPVEIGALVKGLHWATDFSYGAGSGPKTGIDYGHYTLGGVRYTGNNALRGLVARFTLAAGGNRLVRDNNGDITVLGFAPSTFLFRDVPVDNACAGIAPAQATAQLITRAVVIGEAETLRQATLAAPLRCALLVRPDNPPVHLGFWFKDVLCRGDDAVLNASASDTWTDALAGAARSLEWRLYPADDTAAQQSGRDRIRVSGFELEPLQLLRLKLAGGEFAEATIRCRLSLGPDPLRSGHNEIDLTVSADGRVVAEREVAEPLQFVVNARGNDVQRALRLSFAPGGSHLLPAHCVLEYRLGGTWIRAETVDVDALEQKLALAARSARTDLSHSYARLGALRASVSRDAAVLDDERLELALIDPDGHLLLELGGLSGGGSGHRLLGTLALRPDAIALREADGCIVLDQGRARLVLGAAAFELKLGLAVVVAAVPGIDDRAGLPRGDCRILAFQIKTQEAEGDRVLDGVCIEALRADLRLSAAGTEGWGGQAVFDGRVNAGNSIAWPALDWPVVNPADAIPAPLPATDVAKGENNDGRSRVRIGTELATHTVNWRLNAHRVDLALLARIAQADAGAVCSIPVAAEHSLRRGGQHLRWGSVEGLALGHRLALIPAPGTPGEDRSTFAARYRAEWKDGKARGTNPGMSAPGRGSFATVLQGALSDGFRRAAAHIDGFLLVGGFVGLVPAGPGSATAPLLRLPVIAGLGAGVVQCAAGGGDHELAWADGPAARELHPGRPSAPEPANDSCAAIEAALVVRGSTGADAALRSAILVEQTFTATPPTGELAATPYFLGAAISVERVLRQHAATPLPQQGQGGAPALSVLAGRLDAERFAAVLRLTRPLQAAVRTPVNAEYSIVGKRLTQLPWSYAGATDETVLPLLRRLASSRDLDPRAGLLVHQCLTPDARDDATAVSIRAVPFAPMGAAPLAGKTPFRALFPDQGRGPLAPPQLEQVVAPVEGHGRAVRDSHDSGIAGLVRRVGWPCQARGRGAWLPADDLLWVSQSRVPAYLALRSGAIDGPPIHWLTPAPARVRLPVAAEIDDALRPAAAAPRQAFLPSEADVAELSERAGIVTVRRTRVLTAAPDHRGFDPDSARFGRQAQASSSFARLLRTPRPGPLPANAEPARDRRIQASALRRGQAVDCLLGNADTVAGNHRLYGDWCVRVRAEAKRAGIVSDRWDGSLRLRCEIEVSALPADPRPSAAIVLATLLFNGQGEGPVAAAQLCIGDIRLPMKLLRFADSDWNADAAKLEGRVDLLLYPTDAVPGNPATRGDIAVAFSGTALPPVELQLTLHPSASREQAAVEPAGYLLPSANADALAVGNDRAPLTLRLPLFPVTETRGALPLLPLTLLFHDPAFDRDLAGEPASTAAPVAGADDPDRGRLQFWLQAERAQVQCGTSVTLMADLRYERPLSERDQLSAGPAVVPGGDLLVEQMQPSVRLAFSLDTAAGNPRDLHLGRSATVALPLARVTELALANLCEVDGSAAVIEPGDQLVIQAELAEGSAQFWRAAGPHPVAVTKKGLRLRLVLTADPVSPPPPALYAAIERCRRGDSWFTQLLAHAQSPLPWRTDLIAPARDFRLGMMRRSAVFVWTLMRPGETLGNAITVIKQDRNGQTWIPEDEAGFSRPLHG